MTTPKPLVDMTTDEVLEFIHGEYSGRMHQTDLTDPDTREQWILRFGMLIGIGLRLLQENLELKVRLDARELKR